jgi:hypothetical protein
MANSPIRPDADEAWDDLLRQLPRQAQAQPQPFFYGRVQARLAAKAPAENLLVPGWLRRPAYAALLGALVLGLTSDSSAVDSDAGSSSYHAQQLLQR